MHFKEKTPRIFSKFCQIASLKKHSGGHDYGPPRKYLPRCFFVSGYGPEGGISGPCEYLVKGAKKLCTWHIKELECLFELKAKGICQAFLYLNFTLSLL